jgi:hypothetical protein
MNHDMKEFLKDVTGVIEATNFEQYCLWKEYKIVWVENLSGYAPVIGMLDESPVCISLSTAIVKGKKLLFIDPISRVVDYKMIDKWIKKNIPKTAYINGILNKTDPMNFHNIFRS